MNKYLFFQSIQGAITKLLQNGGLKNRNFNSRGYEVSAVQYSRLGSGYGIGYGDP